MEKETITVSIVVPVYNVQDYLGECVESIIKQKFDDFEVILVDDGSTDDSGMLCEQWGEKDSRIKVIHKKNGGLSSARNAGIDISVGKYIVFIDSDDVIHPEYLSTMLKLAEEQSADLVACHFTKGEKCNWNNHGGEKIDVRYGAEILERMNDNDVVVTVAWNKLYHCKFFRDMGFRYPEGKIHEDMFLTPKILFSAEKMVITDCVLYFYRQRPNSIMTEKFSLRQLDALVAIEYRINFFTENGYTQLVKTEYEGYIRKARQLFLKMGKELDCVYDETKKTLLSNTKRMFFDYKIFRQLSMKYKIILLRFLLLHK